MASPEPEMKIDMITGRPRTPNDQYTWMSEKQIHLNKKSDAAFFMSKKPARHLKLKYPMDRYAYDMSQHFLRGAQRQPYCYVEEKYNYLGRPDHDTSRLGASVPWGVEKQGGRTMRHFEVEDAHRYLTIDCYRRPPTNAHGPVYQKFGRPGEGYYLQRNPNETTWFRASMPLNKTYVLEDIQPKTTAEYEYIQKCKADFVRARTANNLLANPYSEYTDRYLLRTRVEPAHPSESRFSYFPWPGPQAKTEQKP